MKRLLCIIIILCAIVPAFTQDIDHLIATIEQNNTTLQALRKATDAEQLAARAEVGLPDPEVGYNYLWGNPSEIGMRHDITVTQTFDAATLGGQRQRVAHSRGQVLEHQYRAERTAILLDARQHLVDLVYCNAMLALSERRLSDASTLLDTQQRRLETGDGTLLDLNNARLSRASLQARHEQLQAERNALLAQLKQLNGGQDIATPGTYPHTPLPQDFEAWYAEYAAHSPLLAEAAADVELSHRLLSLSRAECLPALTVGYMSEKTDGEHYHGITAGLSIPLWSGRSKIRQAKAGIAAAEARQQDVAMQLRARFHALHQQALSLQRTAVSYRNAVTAADNTPLLHRALETGQIALPEYLQQLTLVYDAQDQALAAERDFQHAVAELYAWTAQ